MKKLIGVTPRLLVEDGVQKQFVNNTYVSALLNYDVNVIMLTLDNPCVEDILSLCDGFVITGGSDLDPKYYGETNEGLSKGVDERLDILDKKVVEYAKEHKVPMLGICRGHQSINTFLGGSLFQHIDNHTSIKANHEVQTLPNRLLAFDKDILTNSYHHQAVKKLAPGLVEVAKHGDGTNEAFIHEELPVIGIQWHPEKDPEWKESKLIFDKFIELVNEFKK